MSDSTRTFDDVKTFMKSYDGITSKDRVEFYDVWAENYDKDMSLLGHNSHTLALDCLLPNFRGSREEALVLDVACGTGRIGQLMTKAGFRHFEGIDGSKGMLDQAAQTGFYQDLRLALLGTEPLPAPPGMFDVVITVAALKHGYVPVSVIRELVHAAKPGGLICMTRADHRVEDGYDYKAEMEKELKTMEEEGLWKPVEVKVTDKYRKDVFKVDEKDMNDQNVAYIGGTVYLYRKSLKEPESRA